MKIKFFTRKSYSSVWFEQDCVYDLPEENGFAKRWIKRGCKHVADFDGKLSMNELCIGYKGKEEVLVVEPEIVEPEIVDPEIVEPEIVEPETTQEEVDALSDDEEVAPEVEPVQEEVAKVEETGETTKKRVRKSRAKIKK